MSQEDFETLLNFFKVLGNESRLKIVGILANQECTVKQLAEMLDLKDPTVSQHLNMLKEAKLVSVRPDGNFRFYSFDNKALINLNKDIFSREQLASLVEKPSEEYGDAFERKVMNTFFVEGQLQIPSTEKKLRVIIKWLASQFEVGKRYTEKEVNEILSRYNEDYATLRRELVDFRFMAREKGVYWRLPMPQEVGSVRE